MHTLTSILIVSSVWLNKFNDAKISPNIIIYLQNYPIELSIILTNVKFNQSIINA